MRNTAFFAHSIYTIIVYFSKVPTAIFCKYTILVCFSLLKYYSFKLYYFGIVWRSDSKSYTCSILHTCTKWHTCTFWHFPFFTISTHHKKLWYIDIKKNKIKSKKHIDKLLFLWYTYNRRQEIDSRTASIPCLYLENSILYKVQRTSKKLWKKLKKVLDILYKLCYNKDKIRQRHANIRTHYQPLIGILTTE